MVSAISLKGLSLLGLTTAAYGGGIDRNVGVVDAAGVDVSADDIFVPYILSAEDNKTGFFNYTGSIPEVHFSSNDLFSATLYGGEGGGLGEGGDGGGGGGGFATHNSRRFNFFNWNREVSLTAIVDELQLEQARRDIIAANWEIFLEEVEPTDVDLARNLQKYELDLLTELITNVLNKEMEEQSTSTTLDEQPIETSLASGELAFNV